MDLYSNHLATNWAAAKLLQTAACFIVSSLTYFIFLLLAQEALLFFHLKIEEVRIVWAFSTLHYKTSVWL